MATLSDYQRDILIKTILSEARGEGERGMEAVAHNISNRSQSGKYPSDPAAVALQPKQYSGWNRGEGGNNPNQFRPGTSQYETAAQIIDRVFSGQSVDPTNGALFYHTPQVSPNWAGEVNQYGTTQIGNHIFYNGRPVPPGDIPNQVATQLDVRRPVQPSMPSPMPQSVAQARLANSAIAQGNTAPDASFYNGIFPQARNSSTPILNQSVNNAQAGQDRGLAGMLAQYVARPQGNLTQGGAIDRSVTGAQSGQNQSLAAALERSIRPPTTRMTPSQQRADNGQNRSAPRPAPYSAGTTIASIPTTPQPRAMPRQPNAAERAALAYVPPSNPRIGQPPATRVVPSVQVAASAAVQTPAPTRVALPPVTPATNGRASTAIADQRNEQRQLRPIGQTAPTPLQQQRQERAIVQPTARQVATNTGFRVNAPLGQPSSFPKDQSRLSSPPLLMAAGSAGAVPLAVTQPVTMPTPASQRPAGLSHAFSMPTPLSQRPAFAPQAMGSVSAPLMAASRPLNVVVQGANTIKTSQPVQSINPANHQAAQLRALAAGRNTFTPSGSGVSQPVRAMNGKIRNTY